jgi:hypothetical protein
VDDPVDIGQEPIERRAASCATVHVRRDRGRDVFAHRQRQ